ncbi:MAG: glycosyltransferase [Marinilabiliaceae bacterium]|nr:glycosyltransferase [Marinilabiliaceae bacterium]
MKIIYLANSFIPSRTANSIHVMKMCQALAKVGHDVTLVTFDSEENEEDGIENVYDYYGVESCFSIKKIPLRKVKGKIHMFAFDAIQFIRKQELDLVYTRCEIPALYLTFTSIPFIIEAHKPFVGQSKYMTHFFKRIFCAGNLKRVIMISAGLQRLFEEQVSLRNVDVKVLHDAADLPPESANGMGSKWKGQIDHLQVGYFGHLYKGRGIEVIIEAARKLPQVDFHIVGGRNNDVEYWKSQSGKLNNVFFYGFVLPSEVGYYRHMCDVLLAPYQKEVWVADKGHESSKYMSPLKIFEYMASGKCIISSDMPVLREVLNDQNAILVDPEDATQWCEAINKCAQKSFRVAKAERAWNDFNLKYTWIKRAEEALKEL